MYFQLYKDIKKDAHDHMVKDAGLIVQSSTVHEIHSTTGYTVDLIPDSVVQHSSPLYLLMNTL